MLHHNLYFSIRGGACVTADFISTMRASAAIKCNAFIEKNWLFLFNHVTIYWAGHLSAWLQVNIRVIKVWFKTIQPVNDGGIDLPVLKATLCLALNAEKSFTSRHSAKHWFILDCEKNCFLSNKQPVENLLVMRILQQFAVKHFCIYEAVYGILNTSV